MKEICSTIFFSSCRARFLKQNFVHDFRRKFIYSLLKKFSYQAYVFCSTPSSELSSTDPHKKLLRSPILAAPAPTQLHPIVHPNTIASHRPSSHLLACAMAFKPNIISMCVPAVVRPRYPPFQFPSMLALSPIDIAFRHSWDLRGAIEKLPAWLDISCSSRNGNERF